MFKRFWRSCCSTRTITSLYLQFVKWNVQNPLQHFTLLVLCSASLIIVPPRHSKIRFISLVQHYTISCMDFEVPVQHQNFDQYPADQTNIFIFVHLSSSSLAWYIAWLYIQVLPPNFTSHHFFQDHLRFHLCSPMCLFTWNSKLLRSQAFS